MLGPGVKTFSDPNASGVAKPMQLFSCEQQADGDGSEMAPHVAYGAMQKFTVMPDATSNYVAFIAKSLEVYHVTTQMVVYMEHKLLQVHQLILSIQQGLPLLLLVISFLQIQNVLGSQT